MRRSVLLLVSIVFMFSSSIGESQSKKSESKSQDSQLASDAQAGNIKAENMTKSRIEGVIIDGKTKKPIAGFELYLLPDKSKEKPGTKYGKIVVKTNKKGKFSFDGLPNGAYSIADKNLNMLQNDEGKYLTIPLDGENTANLGTIPINRN